jgi:hypothetical protein
MAIVKHAKVISKYRRISIGREVGIKLANDNEIIVIKVAGEITERSSAIIMILGMGVDVTSVGKVLVEVGVEVEGRKVKNLHAGEKSRGQDCRRRGDSFSSCPAVIRKDSVGGIRSRMRNK